jgi:protein-disulfide isomerase
VFRHFPLDAIHKFATPAAIAGVCANRQGHFWEFHDALFNREDRLTDATIQLAAAESRIDAKRFSMCLGDQSTLSSVAADGALGRELQISSTPAFLLGRSLPDGLVRVLSRLRGALPAQEFRVKIDSLLAETR